MTFKEWFWSQVKIGKPDECWPWTGSFDTDGYGQTYANETATRKCHRLSFMFTYDIDPGENLILHDCDNRACCNPNHLYVGTTLNNNCDCLSRNRRAENMGHNSGLRGFSCLTEIQEQEIRLKHFMKLANTKELAKEYNVSVSVIYCVISCQKGH